jgi:hypothetical protein
MAWSLKSITIDWPPSLEFVRVPGDNDVLQLLFTQLSDKRLLIFGYGPSAGITTLDDLAHKIDDDLREYLFEALTGLRPGASIIVWLYKLQDICQELLTKTNEARFQPGAVPSTTEISPAVDELRGAFLTTARYVAQNYDVPAAERLAQTIQRNRAPGQA